MLSGEIMHGYDLSNFKNGKAFIHFDGVINGKSDYGQRICINTKGEKLFELPDRDMLVNEFEDEDIAFVMGNQGKYAMMNNKGEFLTDFIYSIFYGGSEEGLLETHRNGKHGHIDINGKEVIPCMYDNGRHFSEGIVSESINGKWGMVDYFNNTVIPFEYENICTCKNNIISAQKGGKWGLINKNNEVIADFIYDDIYNWCTRECLAYPASKNGKWGLINRYGNVVEDFIYDEIDLVSVDENNAGEFVQVIKDKRRAIYSTRKKEFITDFDYSFFGYFSDGRISAHINDKVGFLDTNGEVIIPFTYDSYRMPDEEFAEGLCVVYKDGKAGMIDAEGNIIIPFTYKKLYSCHEGMIWAKNNKNDCGFLNRKGEVIIPFGKYYCHSMCFNDGLIPVWSEEMGDAYINKQGDVIEIKI